MALTARTFAEDEEERLYQIAREEGASSSGMVEKRLFERTGRSGHLREIGVAGFLNAIEGELDEIWVVLHIYDPVRLVLPAVFWVKHDWNILVIKTMS